jgi:hypothetical protein
MAFKIEFQIGWVPTLVSNSKVFTIIENRKTLMAECIEVLKSNGKAVSYSINVVFRRDENVVFVSLW